MALKIIETEKEGQKKTGSRRGATPFPQVGRPRPRKPQPRIPQPEGKVPGRRGPGPLPYQIGRRKKPDIRKIIENLRKEKSRPKPSPGRPGGRGKEAPDKRWNKGDKFMTPLRAKHGIGGVIKKGISKINSNPKPKPKPKEVDVVKESKKAFKTVQGKAAGGRIGLKDGGNRPRPQGPHMWVRDDKRKKALRGNKAEGGRIRKGQGGSAAQQHYLQHGYGPTKAKLRTGKPKIAIKGWS